MRNPLILAVALAAAATLSACGHPAPRPAASPSASAVATMSADCQQAVLVTSGVRSHLESDPSDVKGALVQMKGLEKSSEAPWLGLEVAVATTSLAKFQLDTDLGQPTGADARVFAQELDKIGRDCHQGAPRSGR